MALSTDARSGTRTDDPRRNWFWRHRRGLFLIWLFLFAGVAGAAYLLTRVRLPAVGEPLQQTTFIYDADGKPLAALDAGQNRVLVHLSDVPARHRSHDDHANNDAHGQHDQHYLDAVAPFCLTRRPTRADTGYGTKSTTTPSLPPS